MGGRHLVRGLSGWLSVRPFLNGWRPLSRDGALRRPHLGHDDPLSLSRGPLSRPALNAPVCHLRKAFSLSCRKAAASRE